MEDNPLSLQWLVTLEGQCDTEAELMTRLGLRDHSNMKARQINARDVVTMYRPARAMMADSKLDRRHQGEDLMQRFAETRVALAAQAGREGDRLGLYRIAQAGATAYGLLGRRTRQVQLLRDLFGEFQREFGEDPLSLRQDTPDEQDRIFVARLFVSGLIDNDPEFRAGFSREQHREYVNGLEAVSDPHFAGRALTLAQRLVEEGLRAEAFGLLERAVACGNSKPEQIKAARAYLLQLTATPVG